MNSYTISPEREKYHEILKEFSMRFVRPGSIVYDIGKSDRFDYKPFFPLANFYTIDKSENKNPDFLIDIEEHDRLQRDGCDKCDAALCNGVTEQCDNPFKMIKGVSRIVRTGGHILFGISSLAYPVYENDYLRLTLNGAIKLVHQYGFGVLSKEICYRDGQVSYIYLICDRE